MIFNDKNINCIDEKVMKYIANYADVKRETITQKTLLKEDLCIEGLELVDIIMSLEQQYNIVIKDEDMYNVKDLGQLIKVVKEKIKL